MTWTTVLPTEEGLYWFQETPESDPVGLWVEEYANGALAVIGHRYPIMTVQTHAALHPAGQWAGPIPVPTD